MISNTDGIEGVNFLTQSPVRMRILQLLHETDRQTKEEIRTEIDAARTTVQRNLDALAERGWITNDLREYAITSLGTAVFTDVSTAADTVRIVETFAPFLRWFPEDELEFDIRSLTDASITVSDTTTPYAPLNRHIELLKEADRFRCLLPSIGLQPMLVARDCIVRHGQTHESVISGELEQTIRTEQEYAELLEEMLEADHYDAFVSNETIAYYLGIADDRVQIGVEDDDGIPRAIVETSADEIREWADQTYRSYKSRARPLTLPTERSTTNVPQ